MTVDEINAFCAGLPGAEWSDPWGGGHNVWKVGDKSFIFLGAVETGVTVKCDHPDTAQMLIEVGRGTKPRYLTRGGWIHFAEGALDAGEMRERITTSYRTVRASLPKGVQKSLPPLAGG
ncbi:MAG: MmcQ/YjbR family DNA-binding protein [Rhodobacteraceae bacterium]|nr:MmcQ/YjbR family DNA-binding protein [Paracoccaceae bacterium]